MANSVKNFENYIDWVKHENELARLKPAGKKRAAENVLQTVEDRLSWVKKLGQWHLSGGNGQTICGKPMLGNNYAKYIPENEREKCPDCFGRAV